MKGVMNIVFLLALICFSASVTQAETQKYDSCTGVLPAGGFSDAQQTYTIKAYIYDGMNNGRLIIHLNGTQDSLDMIFKTELLENSENRTYSGTEVGDSSHFARLNIKCQSIGDRVCQAELVTNLSGKKLGFKASCLMDKVDLPPPVVAPGTGCRNHCL